MFGTQLFANVLACLNQVVETIVSVWVGHKIRIEGHEIIALQMIHHQVPQNIVRIRQLRFFQHDVNLCVFCSQKLWNKFQKCINLLLGFKM